MSDIDWDQRWEEYVIVTKQKMYDEGICCSLAISCNCGDDPQFCDCAKQRWILEEKDKLGIVVEKPYTCYRCKQGVFHVYMSFHADPMKHVPICYNCINAHTAEKRHSIAYRNPSLV